MLSALEEIDQSTSFYIVLKTEISLLVTCPHILPPRKVSAAISDSVCDWSPRPLDCHFTCLVLRACNCAVKQTNAQTGVLIWLVLTLCGVRLSALFGKLPRLHCLQQCGDGIVVSCTRRRDYKTWSPWRWALRSVACCCCFRNTGVLAELHPQRRLCARLHAPSADGQSPAPERPSSMAACHRGTVLSYIILSAAKTDALP